MKKFMNFVKKIFNKKKTGPVKRVLYREPDRPSKSEAAAKLLWCPLADISFKPANTMGKYRKGYPEGAVIHWTAGRQNGLASEIAWQRKMGYVYFVIDKDGGIAQNFPLDEWGYHAGKSSHDELGTSVSRFFVGVELQNYFNDLPDIGVKEHWYP